MANQDNAPTATQNEVKPFLQLGRLQREIDDLFHSFQSDFKFPDMFGSADETEFLPSVDIYENDKDIKISAELPGVDQSDMSVEVHDDMLTISGEKKSEVEKKDGDNYRCERSYGSFSRSMSLPAGVDDNAIDAKFENGVLTVTVKKPANTERKSKKVPVHKA